MPDPVTPWMDDLEGLDAGSGSAHGRRRTLAIIAMAALPWIVVVALLALPGRLGGVNGPAADGLDRSMTGQGPATGALQRSGAEGAGHDREAHHDEAAGGQDAPRSDDSAEGASDEPGVVTPDLEATAPTEPLLDLVEIRGRWRPAPGPEEAAALAVIVARAWLTSVDPVLTVAGLEPELADGYAEHLVVEAVERPAPEAAVVTLLAIVLDGEPQLRAQVRRLAVPIAWEPDGPRPGGEPWWLPGPNLEPIVADTEPLEDPADQLAAVEALVQAGYRDVELKALRRTSGWPVVADVEARTPGGVMVSGPVWLREHVGRLVVAGTTRAPANDDPESAAQGKQPSHPTDVEPRREELQP